MPALFVSHKKDSAMVGEGNLHICWEMFKKELVRNINGKNDEDSKPTGRFFSRLKAMTQSGI